MSSGNDPPDGLMEFAHTRARQGQPILPLPVRPISCGGNDVASGTHHAAGCMSSVYLVECRRAFGIQGGIVADGAVQSFPCRCVNVRGAVTCVALGLVQHVHEVDGEVAAFPGFVAFGADDVSGTRPDI